MSIRTVCVQTVSEMVNCIKSYISCPKRISIKDQMKTISVTKAQLKLLSCSNIIIRIELNSGVGYLNVCKRHTPFREYMQRAVYEYFELFAHSGEYAHMDRTCILECLDNAECLHKFSRLLTANPYSDSHYKRYLDTEDPHILGIYPSINDELQQKRIRAFIENYAWPAATAYRAHRYCNTNTYQLRNTSKMLATQEMAKLLGLSHMIPEGEYIRLVVEDANDLELFGYYSQSALGICAMDVSSNDRPQVITSRFQREMGCLNLLDTVTHEQDHSPNNYNVVLNEFGQINTISVFDNNGAGTFGLDCGIDFKSFKNCSPFIRADGIVNRPYLDKATASRLLALRKADVIKALRSYLSSTVIFCTWRRIVALKNAVVKTSNSRSDFLLDEAEFSKDTIAHELCGEYGKTYMCSFISDCTRRTPKQ